MKTRVYTLVKDTNFFISYLPTRGIMAPRRKLQQGGNRRTECSPEKMRRLEKWLLSPDRAERMAAIDEINSASCPQKKTVLIKTLAHDDQLIRRLSVEMLGAMREEITEDDILDMAVFLNSKDPALRYDAVSAISRVISEDYAGLVSDSLSSHLDVEDDKKITHTAIIILWSIEAVNEKNRSFKELVDNLFDTNNAVRDSTLKMIRRYREILTTEDISEITIRLDDEIGQNQLIALEALKYIDKPAEVASALMSFFDNIEERHPSTIHLAIEVLGSMRRDADIEDFLRFMRDSDNPKYDTYRKDIIDILKDTMRLIPSDAIMPKETLIDEIQFNFMLEGRIQIKSSA